MKERRRRGEGDEGGDEEEGEGSRRGGIRRLSPAELSCIKLN